MPERRWALVIPAPLRHSRAAVPSFPRPYVIPANAGRLRDGTSIQRKAKHAISPPLRKAQGDASERSEIAGDARGGHGPAFPRSRGKCPGPAPYPDTGDKGGPNHRLNYP